MIAENGHRADKIDLAAAELHRLVDVICQLLFPTLALHPRSVLSGGHSFAAALVRFQDGKPVRKTDFVAEFAQLF